MNPIKFGSTRLYLSAAILAALVGAMALFGPGQVSPAYADETEIWADCGHGNPNPGGLKPYGGLDPRDTRINEGDNYRVHIRPDDWLGLIRGYWYTVPGPAANSSITTGALPGVDYVDVQGLYQEGDYGPEVDDRVVGEFATIEDRYPEENKSFTLRFVNAVEGGENAECEIIIVDEDPGVMEAGILGTPGHEVTYRLGDVFTIYLDYNHRIRVNGAPKLEFRIGDGENSLRTAPLYHAQHGGESLFFRYRVQPGDLDLDGISMDGGYVDDDGVTHGIIEGSVSHQWNRYDSSPWFYGFDLPNRKVDGRVYATATEIISIAANGETYGVGENIEIALTYTNPVVVEGDVLVNLRLGEGSWWRGAAYNRGSGSNTLVFSYTVQPGDQDTDGISLDGSYIDPHGVPQGYGGSGSIKVAGYGIPVHHYYPSLDPHSYHKVDSRVYATAAEIVSTPANGDTYRVGENIEIALTYTNPVEVEGNVLVSLRMGTGSWWRGAAYNRGSGSNTLVFSYTVQPGDLDTDGISMDGSYVDADGVPQSYGGDGTIKIAGTDAPVHYYYPYLPHNPAHKVDGVAPAISSVSIASDPGDDNLYGAGDEVIVTVSFNEAVVIDGAPQMALDFDGTARTADYYDPLSAIKRTFGYDTLITVPSASFTYTVQVGDADADGIAIGADSISLNGATIQDRAGNGAILSHSVLGDDDGHKVDGVKPTISSAAVSADGATVSVTFTENIQVSPLLRSFIDDEGLSEGTAEFVNAVLNVEVNDTWPVPTAATVSGNRVTVTLPTPVSSGETARVRYDGVFAKDTPSILMDLAGNAMTNFGATAASSSSTVTTDSGAGNVVLSVRELTITEGNSATYTVRLAGQPPGDVAVVAIITNAPPNVTISDTSLTFTPDNWDSPQTVTVSSSADDNSYGYWVAITHTASGSGFTGEDTLKVLMQE